MGFLFELAWPKKYGVAKILLLSPPSAPGACADALFSDVPPNSHCLLSMSPSVDAIPSTSTDGDWAVFVGASRITRGATISRRLATSTNHLPKLYKN